MILPLLLKHNIPHTLSISEFITVLDGWFGAPVHKSTMWNKLEKIKDAVVEAKNWPT